MAGVLVLSVCMEMSAAEVDSVEKANSQTKESFQMESMNGNEMNLSFGRHSTKKKKRNKPNDIKQEDKTEEVTTPTQGADGQAANPDAGCIENPEDILSY